LLCVQHATHFDRLNLGLGWAVDFSRIPFSFFLFFFLYVYVLLKINDKPWQIFIFFPFGDPPQDILIEFGYMLKRTLKKVQIFAMSWQHTELVVKIW
jgi:hypothetical protein